MSERHGRLKVKNGRPQFKLLELEAVVLKRSRSHHTGYPLEHCHSSWLDNQARGESGIGGTLGRGQ